MNVLLDRSKDGFLSVALGGDGSITLFRYDASRDEWKTVERVPVRSLGVGEEIQFAVRVHDGTVAVSIDGEEQLPATRIEGAELDGPWGLGIQRGGAGFWRGVRAWRDAELPNLTGR